MSYRTACKLCGGVGAHRADCPDLPLPKARDGAPRTLTVLPLYGDHLGVRCADGSIVLTDAEARELASVLYGRYLEDDK